MEISYKKLSGISAVGVVGLAILGNGFMNTRQNLDYRDEQGNKHNNTAYSAAKGFFPDNWHDLAGLKDKLDGSGNSAELPEIGSERAFLAGQVVVNFAYQG